MLKGCDLSKWQTKTPTGYDFYICKASQGTTVDKMFYKHIENCKSDLIGAYCFATTNKSWLDSAKTFVKTVKTLNRDILLALDIEGIDAKRDGAFEWCLNWLFYVERETGTKPLLYVQSSLTSKFGDLAKYDFGLWVAHWNVKKPRFNKWGVWALWQYSDSNGKLDVDYFNGNKDQFRRYMKRNVFC